MKQRHISDRFEYMYIECNCDFDNKWAIDYGVLIKKKNLNDHETTRL